MTSIGRSYRCVVILIVMNMILCSVPPLRSTEGQSGPGQSPEWWDPSYRFRVLIEVAPHPFPMENYPVEMEINFTELVSDPGFKMDRDSITIVEYTGPWGDVDPIKRKPIPDPIMAFAVPFHLYPVYGYDDDTNAKGTLTWILDGRTTSTRYFHIYFDDITGQGKESLHFGDELALIDSQYWVQRGMVFYGFNPGEEVKWPDVDTVEAVAIYDDTNIEVLDITTKGSTETLFKENIDRGELLRQNVPDGTYFKLVADKPVVASVSSAYNDGGSAKTFYPSTDRNLVGQDFLISPYHMAQHIDKTYGIIFYGVEGSTVSIYAMDGTLVTNFLLEIDGYRKVKDLQNGFVYHIESTGRIMIEHQAINSFTAAPSVTGSPVGKKFFGSTQNFDGAFFMILTYEDAFVNVTDLATGELVFSKALQRGVHHPVPKEKGGVMKVESTGNISFIIGSTEGGTDVERLGDDITYTGGPGGREILTYSIYNPGPGDEDQQYPGEAYPGTIFSFFDGTHVQVDDDTFIMDAGEHMGLEQRYHEIIADRPVSVMTLGRGAKDPAEHRWNDWGTYLAGSLPSPEVTVLAVEDQNVGLDLYPHPSEGSTNDTMVHAVEPGRSTRFRINVENTGTISDDLTLSLGPIPDDWRAELDRWSFPLGPGQIDEVALDVTVPTDARSETRVNISITGTSSERPTMNDTVYAEVVVDPVFFPDLSGESVKYIDPGRTATFMINLTNRGNGPDDITLELQGPSGPGWKRVLSITDAHLDQNETIMFELDVTTPPSAMAREGLVVDILARSGGNSSKTDVHRTRTIVNQIYEFNASVPPRVTTPPGAECTFNVSIDNLGNGEDTYSLDVQHSNKSWTMKHPSSINIAGRDTSTVAVKVDVPGWDEQAGRWSEPPGNNTILISIHGSTGPMIKLQIIVQVLQIFSVYLAADDDEMLVTYEEPATFRLRVKNMGNGEDTIRLSVEDGAQLDKDGITLAPGETAVFNCTVPPSKERGTLFVFLVQADSEGNGTSTATLTVRSRYPGQSLTIGEYSCLWIVLVALAIFFIIQAVRRFKTRGRT